MKSPLGLGNKQIIRVIYYSFATSCASEGPTEETKSWTFKSSNYHAILNLNPICVFRGVIVQNSP